MAYLDVLEVPTFGKFRKTSQGQIGCFIYFYDFETMDTRSFSHSVVDGLPTPKKSVAEGDVAAAVAAAQGADRNEARGPRGMTVIDARRVIDAWKF